MYEGYYSYYRHSGVSLLPLLFEGAGGSYVMVTLAQLARAFGC